MSRILLEPGEPSVKDLEVASFLSFCREVAKNPVGITVKCPSASHARSLRKRFYRIRAALPEADQDFAYQLEASVVGRHFTVRPAGRPINWTALPQETSDDQPSESSLPPSN